MLLPKGSRVETGIITLSQLPQDELLYEESAQRVKLMVPVKVKLVDTELRCIGWDHPLFTTD